MSLSQRRMPVTAWAGVAAVACVALVPASEARAASRAFEPVRIARGRIGFRVGGLNASAVARAYVRLRMGRHRVRIVGVAVSQVRRALRRRQMVWVRAVRVLKRGRLESRSYRRRLRGARLVIVLRSTPMHGGGSPPGGGAPACVAPGVLFQAGLWPPGCWRPYGPSSPFNQPLPANPRVYPSSAAVVAQVLSFGPPKDLRAGVADTPNDYYHPSYYSLPADPVFTVSCTAYSRRCPIEGMTVRIPDAARPAAGGDGHMAVIDQLGGWEYDFWQVRSKPHGGGRLDASWGGRTPLDGDGLGSGATAAKFGLQAGIIRAQELEAGRIGHALFMVVPCVAHGFVYPAEAAASACSNTANAAVTGMRFQLDCSDAEIDALPVPPWKKTILRALAHYGAFVGDTGGSSFGFQFESGSTYTSFGLPDEMVKFAQTQTGVTHTGGGQYIFNLSGGVDWSRLRVIDPCVTEHTC